jgi:hypothetical protein
VTPPIRARGELRAAVWEEEMEEEEEDDDVGSGGAFPLRWKGREGKGEEAAADFVVLVVKLSWFCTTGIHYWPQ